MAKISGVSSAGGPQKVPEEPTQSQQKILNAIEYLQQALLPALIATTKKG